MCTLVPDPHLSRYYKQVQCVYNYLREQKSFGVITVKFTRGKWNTGHHVMSWGAIADHKRNWNRQIYPLQVLEEVHCMLRGHTRSWRQTADRQRQDLGHTPLLNTVGRVLGKVWIGQFIPKKKSMVLLRSKGGVLYKRHRRKRQWETGKPINHKGCWKVTSRTYICLWLCDVTRASTCMRGLMLL